MKHEVLHGDCIEVMRSMEPDSVDAIVTDPPYGLGFMGKKWDALPPGVDVFAECLRVLKPGGHLLAFGGSRTYHRLAVAVEDAGFEVRDQIMWVYGSGFPKSLDVSKAIDKRGGAIVGFEEFRDAVKAAMKANGISRSTLQDALGNFMLSHYLTAGSQPAVPNWRDYQIIRDTVGLGSRFDDLFKPEAEREVIGQTTKARSTSGKSALPTLDGETAYQTWDETAASTPEAQQWEGWGTALKPAHEPIVLARKPLVGTVASNVLDYGTGALNIDDCRIPTDDDLNGGTYGGSFGNGKPTIEKPIGTGRWPANLIHDGTTEATQNMGQAAKYFYSPKASKKERNAGLEDARNTHPTVKPVELMRYLVRLVTPPEGVVLDPFAGSGSTGVACVLEGVSFVGVEREAEYVEIATKRIEHVT